MAKTPIKKAAKRNNLSKDEIKSQLEMDTKVNHLKDVIRSLFPHLETLDTIYDAQTVVNALSGFISAHVEKKLSEIKLSDVSIDLSKEEDSKIKTSIEALIELLQDEPAKDLSQTLERLGKAFSELGAHNFLKKSMSEISVTDIVEQ